MALYAFDGTWNDEKTAGVYGENTNVVEFARAYDGDLKVVQSDQGEKEQPTVRDDFFVGGVGTRYSLPGRIFGGAFGIGGRKRVNEAKAALAANFARGDDKVDIIGFSRGAALALHFSNTVAGMKVKDRNGNNVAVDVRFLGLWDVVASFGIPINVGPLEFQRVNLGYKLTLSDKIRYCFHAVSLDERRQSFRVTRVDNGYQVWFRGVHSDVGGGNKNHKLSNVPLTWMLRKGKAVGLPVDATLPDRLEIDPSVAIRPSRLDLVKNKFRDVTKNDRVHYTVTPRPECNNPISGCPTESKEDEANRILTTAELAREAKAAAG